MVKYFDGYFTIAMLVFRNLGKFLKTILWEERFNSRPQDIVSLVNTLKETALNSCTEKRVS